MNEETINQLIGKGKIVKLKREKFFEILNYQGDLFFQKGKLEEREKISFQVKRLIVDIEKHWEKVPNPKESMLYGLKQLQKEIGGNEK